MNQLSTPIRFTSRLCPEVTFTLNRPTKRTAALATRTAVAHANGTGDMQEEDMVVGLVKSYVRDFDGYTMDGAKPSLEQLALDGPLELVNELTEEIGRLSLSLSLTDDSDDAIIADCEKRKFEAQERKARRKNYVPASSPATAEAGLNGAGNASAIVEHLASSEMSETAMGAPV